MLWLLKQAMKKGFVTALLTVTAIIAYEEKVVNRRFIIVVAVTVPKKSCSKITVEKISNRKWFIINLFIVVAVTVLNTWLSFYFTFLSKSDAAHLLFFEIFLIQSKDLSSK